YLAASVTVSNATSQQPLTAVTVNLSAETIDAGAQITAVVAGPSGTAGDWAGLFMVGASDQNYLDWRYLDGTRTLHSPAQSAASLEFQAPLSAGRYEVRVFAANSYDRLGTSAAVTVTGSDLAPPTAPAITGFGTDTGVSATDRLTSDTTLSFS